MRSLTIALLPLLLAGCTTLPGLSDPQITLEPRYSLLRVTGETRMQSATGAPAHDLSGGFGVGSRDEDYGGSIALGDSFSGFDLSYMSLDQKSSGRGTLNGGGWGALPINSTVSTKVLMDEFRLRYIAKIYEYETEDEIRFGIGAGALLAHRELQFQALAQSGAAQNLEIKDDGIPYAAVRGRINYQVFGLEVDYALNPDLSFGGDFDGPMHDVEATVTYTFEDQDLTVYAGYRREDLTATGSENGQAYETDFQLDGWILGLRFIF